MHFQLKRLRQQAPPKWSVPVYQTASSHIQDHNINTDQGDNLKS